MTFSDTQEFAHVVQRGISAEVPVPDRGGTELDFDFVDVWIVGQHGSSGIDPSAAGQPSGVRALELEWWPNLLGPKGTSEHSGVPLIIKVSEGWSLWGGVWSSEEDDPPMVSDPDYEWILSNEERLLTEYGGMWIAVHHQQVISAAENLDDLMSALSNEQKSLCYFHRLRRVGEVGHYWPT